MDVAAQDYTGSSVGAAPALAKEKPLMEVYQGSGAGHSFAEFYSAGTGQLEPVIFLFPEPIEIKTAMERIQDEILEILSLSMSDLSVLCRVTRKTPYNWRKSDQTVNRRKRGTDRLFKLSEVAHNWRSAGFPQPGHFLMEPMVNGKSLYDLLASDTIDIEAVQFLGTRLAVRQLDTFEVSNPFL